MPTDPNDQALDGNEFIFFELKSTLISRNGWSAAVATAFINSVVNIINQSKRFKEQINHLNALGWKIVFPGLGRGSATYVQDVVDPKTQNVIHAAQSIEIDTIPAR